MAETKQKPVTFISRYLRLKLVRKPGYSKEVDGQRVSVPGTSIQFEQGAYTTSDPDEIKFIEGRSEFGRHIQRVPDNVENLAAAREEQYKDLEQREADIKAREEALAAKEAEISEQESGKDTDETDETDGLEDMERADLLELLKTEKEADPESEDLQAVNGKSKSEDIVAAIRAKRTAADDPAFDE